MMERMQHFLLFLCLSTYSAAIVAAIPDFDCAAGCPKTAPHPVCGSDQRTYGSACFAVCQGVTSYTEGPCTRGQALANSLASPEDMAVAAAEGGPEAAAPVVSLAAMNRFKDEGFNFIGVARTGPQFEVHESVQTYRKNGKPYGKKVRVDPKAPSSLIRMVADGSGYLYASEPIYVAAPSSATDTTVMTAPGFDPQATGPAKVASATTNPGTGEETAPEVVGGGNRRLLERIGSEDRKEVQDTTAFPFRTIGSMSISASGSNGLCTGAVVSQKWILSAAHCVYDIRSKTWRQSVTFNAGRKRTTFPFPSYSATFMTIFDGYIAGDSTYDIAMIKMSNSVGGSFIGDRVGWMGRSWSDNPHSGIVNTAGYPVVADNLLRANGDVMYLTSCTLPTTDDVKDRKVSHTCDTSGGQSGSPVWRFTSSTNTRNIVGVHSGWSCTCCVANSACTRGKGSAGCCSDKLFNHYVPLNRGLGNAVANTVSQS